MQNKHILIIEDNRDLAQLLAIHLRDLHHQVDLCFDGRLGLQKASSVNYDLVVLDLMLPGCDGLTICQSIRAQAGYTPILMLTAKDTESDRVRGLETGADDYVTKPFSVIELLARIKAIFRRADALEFHAVSDPLQKMRYGALHVCPEKRTVNIHDQTVELTAKEFDLLLFFCQHPGRVYSRSELLDHVWGYGHDGYEHTVNSNINRLRVKIEDNPKQPRYIQTVWGVGYKFSGTKSDV